MSYFNFHLRYRHGLISVLLLASAGCDPLPISKEVPLPRTEAMSAPGGAGAAPEGSAVKPEKGSAPSSQSAATKKSDPKKKASDNTDAGIKIDIH